MGCAPSTELNKTATYFGGQIINPKSNYVLFLKDDAIIDTIKLDKRNHFLAKFNQLKEGLYTFKHGVEFQYIYLQPADSVLVRLNTWNFDESLVFTGKGSAKNEFLINLFLQNEKEDELMYRFFNLSENKFENKIDSIAEKRNAIYSNFKKNQPSKLSNNFNKLAQAAINYPLFRIKEIYPYYYRLAHNSKQFPSLNKSFYAYRNNIDLNEASLISFYPYQNYVMSYLYNLSYQEFDMEKHNLTDVLIEEIAKHIKLENFKNTLLKRVVVNDFLKSETTCNINEKTLALYLKYCTNPNYRLQVINLVHDSKFVKNNHKLPNFKVNNISNTKNFDIAKLINGSNTILYFWSTEFMSSDYLVGRINYLKKRFPEFKFIGIQLNTNLQSLTNDPNLKKLDTSYQYNLVKNSNAYQFLTSNYPRTIIIDKKGMVVNGFTYLGSKYLTNQLSKLEK